VDFSLERGETLCIVGESGCGKSLTALALLDLLPAAARRRVAKLEFAGQDLSALTPSELGQLRGARIAMIFQEPTLSLNPLHRVERQLVETIQLHKPVGETAARRRALELLELVKIDDAPQKLKSFPHEMSGGQRQRVMI
ncbi:MAG: ABC transporter ATP-binding protein, partial [Rhodospirillaceae bacterium]|nr:ABC transporter ATP-binding protein [Rhodospirillaceae bacterium]